MLLQIPDVLSPAETAECRRRLEAATWIDGGATAGHQSRLAKRNMQLAEDDPAAAEMGGLIASALGANPLFVSAALPFKVFPPLFNRYEGGQNFGTHVDNAIRRSRVTGDQIRTDLSATLFFSDPEEYEGGELVIEDTYGEQPPSRHPGDAGGEDRVVLLDTEHGARRRLPHAVVRYGLGDTAARRRRPARRVGRAADGRVPQPASPLGGGLIHPHLQPIDIPADGFSIARVLRAGRPESHRR
jgi:hypothetical protein